MADFWLATFEIASPVRDRSPLSLFPVGTNYVAIEVLRDGDELGVLFSSVDQLQSPSTLTCHLGFTNGAKACNVWLDRGFPLIDASIDIDTRGVLRVVSPFFAPRESEMRYTAPLLTLEGISFGAAHSQLSTQAPIKLAPQYSQRFQSADSAQPDALVSQVPVTWLPTRSQVQRTPAAAITLDLGDPQSRCPTLAPLTTGALHPKGAWTGTLLLPTPKQSKAGSVAKTSSVAHTFGPPAFRFEDVEILGFRINLAEVGDFSPRLEELVRPLNFHLAQPRHGAGWQNARADFRYRAATPTLVIELLRYGRMKARVPAPPLEIDDSQGQHELLVRVLVGRVDDDTAQAHSPAVFVPAIFVDNPWSKMLGRERIGFDKRLAQFFVKRNDTLEPLLPDGRLVRMALAQSTRAEAFGDIAAVNLVERVGGGSGKRIFEVTLPPGISLDTLAPLDLDSMLGTSAFFGTSWRQTDFDAEEFRRSFASAAVVDTLRTFRTIQVAPVAPRGPLKHTWVGGTVALDDDLRANLPAGTATLRLNSVPPAKGLTTSGTPKAWNTLCDMLGSGGTASVVVQSGSWYRLSCSMDLTIDDGLDWR